ncbi:MAG: GNAT family N-acetyltransferase [Candidatus Dormibacteria bacterium]
MRVPAEAPPWLEAFTASERPDLWDTARTDQPFRGLWPEYNHHGNLTPRYFGALVPRHAHLQILFVDRRSLRMVARGRTIPFRWDGTLEALPAGIDAVGLRGVDDPARPTALSALAAEVTLDYQGLGLSGLLIRAMTSVAHESGLSPLVAPIRPSWKDRYPLVPIERYAKWRRSDGLPLDPWMRVHERVGGTMLRVEPRSLHINAAVADWETWTKMAYPEDGQYVFPGGLAPLTVAAAVGDYWEPNIWMLHEV